MSERLRAWNIEQAIHRTDTLTQWTGYEPAHGQDQHQSGQTGYYGQGPDVLHRYDTQLVKPELARKFQVDIADSGAVPVLQGKEGLVVPDRDRRMCAPAP